MEMGHKVFNNLKYKKPKPKMKEEDPLFNTKGDEVVSSGSVYSVKELKRSAADLLLGQGVIGPISNLDFQIKAFLAVLKNTIS